MQFTFEQIDQLKQQYTDKLVAVDGERPELQRFSGITGKVKTVNMSGRALVEFEANNNIGWYDIDLDFLQVIDAPLPKLEPKKEAAPAKKAPAEAAEKPAAAAKPAAAGKKSTADILAAARAGKAAGGAAPAAKKPAAEKPAAAAKPAGGKMSTADILAAARAKKQEAVEQPAPVAEGSVAEQEVEELEASAPAPKAAKAPQGKPSGSLPTNTADKIAWCRQADTK
jgi:hypothetical protein